MSSTDPTIEIVEIDRAEIAVEPWRWEFAIERRADIERHFADRQRLQPALWNGRVLLLRDYSVRDRVLRGASFETDYASFLAWRDWGYRDGEIFNIFACAALRTADGAYIVGRMGPSTAAAGLLYFPCGTPDPTDVTPAATLDLAGNMRRELMEETGLDLGELTAEPGWTLVRDRRLLALMKRVLARQNADELRDRIMRHLAGDPHPEFSDIRIVRERGDLDANMPRFVVAFLEKVWRA